MKRREFLAASCLAGVAMQAPLGAQSAPEKQIIELRRYQAASAEKQAALLEFLGKAAAPAWNRQGINPVGIFQMLNNETLDVFVLLPHVSLAGAIKANAALMADAAFVEAGQASLGAPMKDPLYQRYTSTLLLGFDQCPRVEPAVPGDGRIFQLRIYESHNLAMARRKIEMFDKGSEIDLFRRTGLNPVFFGEALAGDRLPNLTYMLSFPNEQNQKESWSKFVNHPDWKKLSADPYYKDTVSNITNIVLKPAAGSQL